MDDELELNIKPEVPEPVDDNDFFPDEEDTVDPEDDADETDFDEDE